MIEELAKALEKSWCKRTCAKPGLWRRKNPAFLQCSATSLVVQDYVKGAIVGCWARADGVLIWHYFNRVRGAELDFSPSQLPKGYQIGKGENCKGNFATTRAYLLSNEDTERRCLLLKERVEHELEKARK
ncbi:MAG: hypothetical protein QF486_06475 [Candidatus Woesearchaeota archaeon]|jgi:hypothetical protein|nr:hypothetical protein [Candidatus Woesearchaeota archaeon]MDP7181917.1 hypothetical protein [Candidatus Woesearchaeota archaeon]MDP7199232.1 hypothetical protein [Candidatus Woesearchaeota archaeon]MDP7467845.1 hypothetical protein [Candidatus Woesearchaeota archaeon]